jgi:hypothetical protein
METSCLLQVEKMKNQNNILYFPTIADPNIEEVFNAFLKSQRKRLKPRTYRRYKDVVGLFRHYLNAYGHQELTGSAEVALYERLYLRKNFEFCSIFGPGKILSGLSTFLNYFMIRKVMASEALLRASGTVTKKLVKWLYEREYISKEEATAAMALASQATRELPAAERLARLLYDYTQGHVPRYWTTELDDYFVVEDVQPGVLYLSGLTTEMGTVEVKVPQEITDHCKEGWHINLLLVETRNGWRILETGNVYPHGNGG